MDLIRQLLYTGSVKDTKVTEQKPSALPPPPPPPVKEAELEFLNHLGGLGTE
jgi:hypothetical protein